MIDTFEISHRLKLSNYKVLLRPECFPCKRYTVYLVRNCSCLCKCAGDSRFHCPVKEIIGFISIEINTPPPDHILLFFSNVLSQQYFKSEFCLATLIP